MGRALLIITLGSFIVLGIIQQAVNNRQITMTEGNIESFMASHGKNAAGSALELAIHRLMFDENLDDPPHVWQFEIDDFNVNVAVDDHDADPTAIQQNELRLTSTVQLPNRTLQSFAFVDRASSGIPGLDGALTVFGPNSRVRLDGVGAQLKIDGNDTNPSGITADLDDNIAGISSVSSRDDLFSQISGAASRRVFYDGEPDFEHNPDADDTEINQLFDDYLDSGTIYTEGGNLGTDSNPVINIIDSNVNLGGGESFGAGVLVIKPSASLKITGNFTYHGIILVAGKLEIAGTPQIYGGTILMDTGLFEDSLIQDPDDDHATLSGTPGIIYSSWVLNNLRQNLSGGSGSNWALNRISY